MYGSSICSLTAYCDSGYRCLCPELRSAPGNSADSGSLVWQGFSCPYKLIESHLSSLSCFLPPHHGEEFPSSYRQHSGNVLCEQREMGQIVISMLRRNTALGVLHHQCNPPQSLSPSGCPEQFGRPAEQIIHQSPQVVSPPRHIVGHIFQVWCFLHIDLLATQHNRKCHQFCS